MMGSRGASSGRRSGGGARSVTHDNIGGLSTAYVNGMPRISTQNERKQAAFREIAKAPIGTIITDDRPGIGARGTQTYEIVSYRGGKGIRSTDAGSSYASRRGYKINGANSLYKVMGASSKLTIHYPKARTSKA